MKRPKHITIFPIGIATIIIGLLVLAFVPFFIGATQHDQSTHTLLLGFNEKSKLRFEAYLDHEVDGYFGGFRNPIYPMARIDITRDETWYAPPHPRRGSRNKLMKLYSSDSFEIRIMDGEESAYWNVAWDYPPVYQRQPPEILPGSMLDQGLQDLPTDIQESLRRVFTATPDPSNPIPQPRRSELIDAMQRKLIELGYQWVSDGIDRDQWTRTGPHYPGWTALIGSVAVILSFGILIDRLKSKH